MIQDDSTDSRYRSLRRWLVLENEDDDDNRNQVVLKPEHFRIAAASVLAAPSPLEQQIRDCKDYDPDVTSALATLRKKGLCPLINELLEWEEHNGLLYYKGKLYIPNNRELCAAIVKLCHKTPTTEHPGKHAILELIMCSYWWPQMSSFIEKFVLGCEQCQRYKPVPHSKATLQPQEVSDAH